MKKIFLLCFVLVYGLVGFSDPPAVHGMLLFGNKSTYVSHLPMFHQPHDYQLISEVELKNIGTNRTVEKYLKVKKDDAIFTLVPKPMDLTKVMAGEIKTFEATIYQGHFERQGTPLGQAMVSIKKIITALKIAKEKGPSLDFISFGHDGEYFLAHVIKGQPTYDAIYASEQPFSLVMPPCGRGGCGEPYNKPIADHALPVVISEERSEFGAMHPENLELSAGFQVRVVVKKPFYVEYKELAH